MKMTRRHRTAIHEAGHAVVGAYLGVALSSVTIKPDFGEGRSWGQAVISPTAKLDEMSWSEQGRCKIAMMALAGQAADELFYPGMSVWKGKYLRVRYFSDRGLVWRASGFIATSEADLKLEKEWVERRLAKVREIVRIPYVRAAIRVVAEDLLQSTTLPHKHVIRALRDCRSLLSSAA